MKLIVRVRAMREGWLHSLDGEPEDRHPALPPTFVFKYDVDAPHLLHIFARHLTEPDDALDVWFDPTTSGSGWSRSAS